MNYRDNTPVRFDKHDGLYKSIDESSMVNNNP